MAEIQETSESTPQEDNAYSFDKAWTVAHAIVKGKDAAITARQEAEKNKSLNPVKVVKRLQLLDEARQTEKWTDKRETNVTESVEFRERIRSSDIAKQLYYDAIERARKFGDEELARQLGAEIALDATDLYEKVQTREYQKERHATVVIIEDIAELMVSPKPKEKRQLQLPYDLEQLRETFAVLGTDYGLQPDPANSFAGEFQWGKPWDKFDKIFDTFTPAVGFDAEDGRKVVASAHFHPGFEGNKDEVSIPSSIDVTVAKY